MMRDWIKARNYGIQTGDMQYVRPYMLDTFKSDIEFLNSIEKLYKEGGWVIEGTSEYQAESDLMYDEEAKEYWVLTRRLWTYGLYIHPNGKMRKRTNTGNENETFMFRYRYKDGYWFLSAGTSAQMKERYLGVRHVPRSMVPLGGFVPQESTGRSSCTRLRRHRSLRFLPWSEKLCSWG